MSLKNIASCLFITLMLVIATSPSIAQETAPEDVPAQDGADQTPSVEEGAEPAPLPEDQQTVEPDVTTTSPVEGRKTNKVSQFSGLDKITGRIISFDVYINETVQFGALQVTPRVCYSRPASETPKTTSFIEVDEITLDRKIRRIFTGWMFADSPGLNAVEHPVYDVWLTACKDKTDVPAPAKQ